MHRFEGARASAATLPASAYASCAEERPSCADNCSTPAWQLGVSRGKSDRLPDMCMHLTHRRRSKSETHKKEQAHTNTHRGACEKQGEKHADKTQ